MSKNINSIDEEKRIVERRQQILTAAASVFARRGYHRAQLQEIADKAGVAAGTIYNYFENKEDLLLSILKVVITESMPATLSHIGDENESWMSVLLAERVNTLYRNKKFIMAVAPEVVLQENLRREYIGQVIKAGIEQAQPLFDQALENGSLRSFNPHLVYPAMIGALLGAIVANEYASQLGSEKVKHEVLIDELVDLFLNGINSRADSSLPDGKPDKKSIG